MATNYQKTVEFNTKFGNVVNTTHQPNLLSEQLNNVMNRFKLIKEEIRELSEAFDDNNTIEIIDAAADILYVTYGMASFLGIDMDREYYKFYCDIINKKDAPSILSKFLFRRGSLLPSSTSNYNLTHSLIEENDVNYYRNLLGMYLEELENDINGNNFNNVITDLVIITFGSYAVGIFYKTDMDEAFRLVHESNMSKLCFTEKDAIDTVQYYKDHPELGYESPSYRISEDGTYWVVFNETTKKILKSIKYHPVNLTSVVGTK